MLQHLIERILEGDGGTLITHTPNCPACKAGIPPSPILWPEDEEDCELNIHECPICKEQYHCTTTICEKPRLVVCRWCRSKEADDGR